MHHGLLLAVLFVALVACKKPEESNTAPAAKPIATAQTEPTVPSPAAAQAPAPSTPACIVPGTYELAYDGKDNPKKKWRNLYKNDKLGDCSFVASTETLEILVKLKGGALSIDHIVETEAGDKSFTEAKVTRTGPCEATLIVGAGGEVGDNMDFTSSFTAKLTFADGKITGTALKATIHQRLD